MLVHTPYPYERLRKAELADLKIDEVIIDASLSMDTSPTTKRIAPFNFLEINLKKI
uniref:Uncharacterized protein n=1 Tax=Arundo donax TaxID=35708 RepID=A0A0A9CK81_ARUDO